MKLGSYKRNLVALALGLTGFSMAIPENIEGQTPIAIELRGDYAIPVADLSDAGAEADIGFGADAFVHIRPALAVYGGWSREVFSCDLCTDDQEIRSEGFDAGLQLTVARGAPVELLFRGGVVYHKIVTDVGITSVESDRKLGAQGTVAVAFAIGESIALVPGVRFQTLDPEIDLDGDDLTAEGKLSFVALQLGIRIGH